MVIKKVFGIIRLSRQAFGEYKLQIAILTGLGFLSGILGGIGISAVIPLFSFIVDGASSGDDIISQYIEKFFLFLNIDFALKYLLIFIVSLFIFKTAVLVLLSYIEARIATEYERRTRINLFQAFLQAEWPYLLKQKLGHLEKVLMSNVEKSRILLTQIGIFIRCFTSLTVYTLIAVNISPFIALVSFGSGGLLFFLFKPIIRQIRNISYKTERIKRDIAHHINESILGMKTVKVMSMARKIASIGKEYFNKIKSLTIKSSLLGMLGGSLTEPISIIFIAALFAFSYRTQDFNLAALVVIIYLVKQIFAYISDLQKQVMAINEMSPYLRKVLQYETEAIKHKERDKGTRPFRFNRALEFRDVYFSYQVDKEVLSGINFKIKKGEIIGLIGPSGAGKTTIVDLVLRLFNPASGKILLDNTNIAEIELKDWRENIGYVSQDIFLINDTIANNIKFYDQSISDKEVAEAAKMANIYDFVQSCPDGFSTIVGEQGVLCSAGQRQRIIIARVLARKPKLLILDEATSALDNESEAKIQQVIRGLKRKITVFVIAHRLSTVVNSDKLIILEKGKIIEQGTAQELLENKRSYFSKVYHLRE